MSVRDSAVITYGGSVSAILFGLSAAEIAAFGGLLTAVLGLVLNQYWQHKAYKLKELELKERMHAKEYSTE